MNWRLRPFAACGAEGKQSLQFLAIATAYQLKESYGQRCSNRREGWARRFFNDWCGSLRWQRLKPYQQFAVIIERHWDGITSNCKPEDEVSHGFVEGLSNKICVIQLCTGFRDEAYLRLRLPICMLPMLRNSQVSPTQLRDEPFFGTKLATQERRP
jgi:transposase